MILIIDKTWTCPTTLHAVGAMSFVLEGDGKGNFTVLKDKVTPIPMEGSKLTLEDLPLIYDYVLANRRK